LRIRSRLLMMGSQALLILAGARLALHDLAQSYLANPIPHDWSGYWHGFFPRILNSGVFIGSLFFASRWYGRSASDANAQGSWRLSPRADLPFGPPPAPSGIAIF